MSGKPEEVFFSTILQFFFTLQQPHKNWQAKFFLLKYEGRIPIEKWLRKTIFNRITLNQICFLFNFNGELCKGQFSWLSQIFWQQNSFVILYSLFLVVIINKIRWSSDVYFLLQSTIQLKFHFTTWQVKAGFVTAAAKFQCTPYYLLGINLCKIEWKT